MGKRAEKEQDAIRLYAEGKEIPQISAELEVSENTLRKWKKWAGTEWLDARKAARKGYVDSMEEVGTRLRRSREITALLAGDIKSQGNMGVILNEALRTMMYDIMNQVGTIENDPDAMGATIKQLNNLAMVLQRAETAASRNLKNEQEIRKQALADAVKAVDSVARKSGLSDEAADEIRKKILGIGV